MHHILNSENPLAQRVSGKRVSTCRSLKTSQLQENSAAKWAWTYNKYWREYLWKVFKRGEGEGEVGRGFWPECGFDTCERRAGGKKDGQGMFQTKEHLWEMSAKPMWTPWTEFPMRRSCIRQRWPGSGTPAMLSHWLRVACRASMASTWMSWRIWRCSSLSSSRFSLRKSGGYPFMVTKVHDLPHGADQPSSQELPFGLGYYNETSSLFHKLLFYWASLLY